MFSIGMKPDFNVNLIQISKNEAIRIYANMLVSSNCKCTIDLPTQIGTNSKTLLDHIYINEKKRSITSGVIACDLNDHYSIFAIISNVKN